MEVKKRRTSNVKAEKNVTRHDGYTSIKYRYSRKPYITDVYDYYISGSPHHENPKIRDMSDEDDLPFDQGSQVYNGSYGYVSRAFCPFCGKVMEERWTEKENREFLKAKSYITRKCVCGHEVDMLVPAIGRFKKEEKFDPRGWREDGEIKERYGALLDADSHVKYDSIRLTYINLFDEKYDKVTAVIGYAVACINRKTGNPAPLNGSVKVVMNMKTGMTYIKNARFFKRDCPDIVKLFRDNGLKSICYGMPSWISYGIIKKEYGKMVIDALEEPEVVKHFAENIIRYKGLDKSSLTQTGDFSDTLFGAVCIANNSPGYTFRSYAVMAHMKDLAVRDRIKNIKADMKKGEGFMARKYLKDMPKSLRKIIVKDPVYYYFFRDLRTMGFTDTNVMKRIANEKTDRLAAAMAYVSKRKNEDTPRFIKEYMNRYGEKKTAKMLCSMEPDGKYLASEDFRVFEDAEKLFDAFVEKDTVSEADMSGKTIEEIHDNLSVSHYKLGYQDSDLVYGNEDENLEKTVDGYEFRLPKTRYELFEIGKKMHNCAALYYDYINTGTCVIITAMKKSRFEMCIQVQDKAVIQARGNCNESLTEEQFCVLNRWATESNLTVEDRL